LLSKAPTGILSCRIIKPVKVVRKGFLTTPEESWHFSVPIVEELKLRI
jgi:hypothetical protein